MASLYCGRSLLGLEYGSSKLVDAKAGGAGFSYLLRGLRFEEYHEV